MRGALVALAVAVAVFAAAGCGAGASSDEAAPAQTVSAPQQESLADVVAGVLPSVVNVKSGIGEGSGVVIDASGTILTNNHVVQGSDTVTIVASGNRRLQGEVVGTEPERDLAVVCVDPNTLEAVEIGRSGRLRLGDDVVALGFPLGIGGGPTVTRGIVSGLNRSITPMGGAALRGVIQTDAAINPGNSGGPLVDGRGRLVGINTAGASAAFAENVGFAIAIDGAMGVVRDLLGGGKSCTGRSQTPEEGSTSTSEEPSSGERGYLGASVADSGQGALIVDVVPGGPADQAGLEADDVITSVDGEPIAGAEDLIDAIAARGPGDEVDLGIAGGQTVRVELGERP